MLSRFIFATLRFQRRQSDWVQSHGFELILLCETAKLEDCHGKVTHTSTYSINGFIKLFLMTARVYAFHETYQVSPDPSFPVCDTESDPHWDWLSRACETAAG